MQAAVFDWHNIGSYREAREKYESVAPVKFKLKPMSDAYGNDCRPLGSRRRPWRYITRGVERGEGGMAYYDCVYYRTPMVRYYEDGRIVVTPAGLARQHHTMTSSQFINATLPDNFACWREVNHMVLVADWDRPNFADYKMREERKREISPGKFQSFPAYAYDNERYYKDLAEQRVKIVLPHKEELLQGGVIKNFGIELDMAGDGMVEVRGKSVRKTGFKFFNDENQNVINKLTPYYLVVNKDVTKLHRKEVAPLVEQALALASIIDESYVEFDPMPMGKETYETVEGIFDWVKREFSYYSIHPNPGRFFQMPTKKQFAERFYPRLYWMREQTRDVQKDPSLFDIVPFKNKWLRQSKRWYGLHPHDPRRQTHPNIF